MWRTKTALLFGVADATGKQVCSNNNLRDWVVIQCDFDTGIPLIVMWGEGSTSATYGNIILQPGESITFSSVGDLPWTGQIFVEGSGGTAGYRGAEVSWEKT